MPPRFFLIGIVMLGSMRAPAQTAPALPGCQTSPEFQKILQGKFDAPEIKKLPYFERNEAIERAARALIEQYPREREPYQRLIATLQSEEAFHPEKLAALERELEQKAKEHPDDALMQFVAATSLRDRNTARSIELNERAIALAPEFPWPYADLTGTYSHGKTEDKAKARENARKFWSLCPTSDDGGMRYQLMKDTELQAKVATAERAYLEKATDPKVLENYHFLWGLEFRAAAVADYPAVRKRVADDLARLEKANPKPDAAWANFLIEGLKQSGAAPDAVTAKEDELLKDYPQSMEAFQITESRWFDAHPKPESQTDVEAWEKWRAAERAALAGWRKDFPDQDFFLMQSVFFAEAEDEALTEAKGVALTDTYVAGITERWGPESYVFVNAADFLLNHNWQPERALELLRKADELDAKHEALDKINDNRTQKQIDDATAWETYGKTTLWGDMLRAATRAHQPEAVDSIRAHIEARVPTDKKYLPAYWQDRGLLAVMEGHKADALAYYRLALESRPEAEKMRGGVLHDKLADEAHALWKEMGGSESAWAAWNPTGPKATANADAARWEKPKQALPAFTLSDLSGKTWKLADLHGKVVLINLWATWCGPCQAELPHLEKLYEQVKDRNDVQILTFDIDEDPGLLAPFMKKKGFTFPVLPAYAFTLNLLNGVAIPQNWLVDGKGAWQWTQVGFGADDAWQKDMLAKMEAVKAGE